MSLATLKKKTDAKYNNLSVGEKQFSIYGTRRLQGFVGQNLISRSLPKTPMVGNVVRGHGGLNGFYKVSPIVQSAVQSTEDPTVVKKTVLNTRGMLDTRFPWIRRPEPFSSTKETHRVNSAEEYTTFVKNQTIQKGFLEDSVKGVVPPCKNTCVNNNWMFHSSRRPARARSSYSITKPLVNANNTRKFISHAEYLESFNQSCPNSTVRCTPDNYVVRTTYGEPIY